jgi:CHAT domain-containing protein
MAMRSTNETNDSTSNKNFNISSSVTPFQSALRTLFNEQTIKLDPIPASEIEVQNLNKLFKSKSWTTSLLTGMNATETSIKNVNSPTVLHIATHCYFMSNERSGTAGFSKSIVEKNPMLRSMLFFTGAQNTLDKKVLNTSDDGILTAYEAQNINLSATELVTLSACQTAQGKIQNGEGVYGLQRAFRIAGAKCILVSLWNIDDVVTQEFMSLFYSKWLNGASKLDAFYEAQLTIKKKYAKPFYWASFVLIGE